MYDSGGIDNELVDDGAYDMHGMIERGACLSCSKVLLVPKQGTPPDWYWWVGSGLLT